MNAEPRTQEELKKEWGQERFVEALYSLSVWYKSRGVPKSVEEIEKLMDEKPDAFEIFKARTWEASTEILAELESKNKPDNKIYTAEEITEMADTWANYSGFTADKCGKCQRTANVLAGGPGWICECEAFNVLPWSGTQIPHENPDIGTPLAVIMEGHKASRKISKLSKLLRNYERTA